MSGTLAALPDLLTGPWPPGLRTGISSGAVTTSGKQNANYNNYYTPFSQKHKTSFVKRIVEKARIALRQLEPTSFGVKKAIKSHYRLSAPSI